jgi:DNA-binding response OmpR family regulator
MPVVALSAFTSTKERKHSLSHGFADYLSKPIVPEQLIRTIARLTNRSLPIVHQPAVTRPPQASAQL